jgi:hypothetical protein
MLVHLSPEIVDRWSLAVGRRPRIGPISFFLFDFRYWILDAGYWLLDAGDSLEPD